MNATPPIIEARALRRHFPMRRGWFSGSGKGFVKAVDGVSFAVHPGTTVGIVGESGCGKTTTSRMVLRLERPDAGEVLFEGVALARLGADGLRRYRQSVQAVFQDPYSSLSPRLRVHAIIEEPLQAAGVRSADERRARTFELLDRVGLPRDAAFLYPHEFSGGQRQRIAIARALSTRPRLIVLDEPVSALDVSIRAQVLNLLLEIQRDTGVGFLLIAHDLDIVRHMSDEVCVMYLGAVVEQGPTDELYERPRHPYTQALLAATLPDHPAQRAAPPAAGEMPSPLNPPSGCAFRTRCPHAMPVCGSSTPALLRMADGSPLRVACHLVSGATA